MSSRSHRQHLTTLYMRSLNHGNRAPSPIDQALARLAQNPYTLLAKVGSLEIKAHRDRIVLFNYSLGPNHRRFAEDFPTLLDALLEAHRVAGARA